MTSQHIFDWLERHDVLYRAFTHPAVYTVQEAEQVTAHIDGVDAKTLLVKGEKSKKFYLVSLIGTKQIEQSRIKTLIGERIRFADATDLERILHTYPGAVSPLGLVFDQQSEIQQYLIDKDILDADIVTWHPNDNTQTLQFTQGHYQKILNLLPHQTITY